MTPDEFIISRGFCHLNERQVASLSSKKREFVKMRHRDIYGSITKRKFYPTLISGRCVLADVVTGTMYDAMTGRCLSSQQCALVVAQGAIEVKPKRRKSNVAKEAAGWMNEKRRAA